VATPTGRHPAGQSSLPKGIMMLGDTGRRAGQTRTLRARPAVLLAVPAAIVGLLAASGSASAAARQAGAPAAPASIVFIASLPATNNSRASSHFSVAFSSGFTKLDQIYVRPSSEGPRAVVHIDTNPHVGFTIDTEGGHDQGAGFSVRLVGTASGAPFAGTASVPGDGARLEISIAGTTTFSDPIKDGPFSFPSSAGAGTSRRPVGARASR
jgi:hypothetical protein